MQSHSFSFIIDDVFANGKLIYKGKYEYTGFELLETDNRSDLNSYGDIAPLCSEYIHYLFEVPEEVNANSESLVFNFSMDSQSYTVKLR